jgi:hypothetical protein
MQHIVELLGPNSFHSYSCSFRITFYLLSRARNMYLPIYNTVPYSMQYLNAEFAYYRVRNGECVRTALVPGFLDTVWQGQRCGRVMVKGQGCSTRIGGVN